jgi:hypothetical protein
MVRAIRSVLLHLKHQCSNRDVRWLVGQSERIGRLRKVVVAIPLSFGMRFGKARDSAGLATRKRRFESGNPFTFFWKRYARNQVKTESPRSTKASCHSPSAKKIV